VHADMTGIHTSIHPYMHMYIYWCIFIYNGRIWRSNEDHY